MHDLEAIQAKLTELYAAYFAFNNDRFSRAWPLFFLGCLLLLVSGKPVLWGVAIGLAVVGGFSFIKYLRRRNQFPVVESKINELEKLLLNKYGLLYCGCCMGSHFFDSKTERFYHIEKDVLFDHHPMERYRKWLKLYGK